MKFLWQIGIILAACFLGEGISMLLPVPFPASVIAMLVLLAALAVRVIKPEKLHESSHFLMSNMSFLFVPSGVGIITIFDSIRGSIIPLLAVCILSTIITFAATSFTVRLLVRLQRRLSKGREVEQ